MNNSVKSTGTLVQWIRNNPHCLAMLYFVFYLIAFFSLEQLHRPDLHIIHCALDDYIPFCEWFIIPYCLWFLVMPGSLIYFMFRDKKAFLAAGVSGVAQRAGPAGGDRPNQLGGPAGDRPAGL